MTVSDDLLHRFIFDNTDIRGEIVTLHSSLNGLFAQQHYPLTVKKLLGEFMAAAALLSSTLKFDGLLTLQARGDGPLSLIMAETNHNRQLRGIAKFQEPLPEFSNLPALIGKGVLSIIIDPQQGKRYQGIVPLDGPNLADCLEHYFMQSEQLPTRLWLASDGTNAGGLLLQRLPQQVADSDTNQQVWENRIQLANTITAEELLHLDHMMVLKRLFHEEGVRYFEPAPVSFHCRCSWQRSAQMLTHLGEADALALAQENGGITVECDFCGQVYHYNEADVTDLFSPQTRH